MTALTVVAAAGLIFIAIGIYAVIHQTNWLAGQLQDMKNKGIEQ
ncbi:hypothetical protein [Cupriavidus oxalaticus]|nr:hypothetical protein [Cupriavidus oxalaticus]